MPKKHYTKHYLRMVLTRITINCRNDIDKKMNITERQLNSILKRVIKEELTSETMTDNHASVLSEMATFGSERWGNRQYKIAIHGVNSGDRPTPHIHIYYNQERNTRNPVFNFEISLLDILERNELNLIYQKDKSQNIKRTNRSECNWTGYKDIFDGLLSFLTSTSKCPIFGKQTSNLGRAIYEWNKETNYDATENKGVNVLGRLIDKSKVLPEYQSLVEDYIQQKPSEYTNKNR